MSLHKLFSTRLLILLTLVVASAAIAQPDSMPTTVGGVGPARPQPAARWNNLYCAGFIQTAPISTEDKIIGGQDEAEKYLYSQNDYLHINMGSGQGVKVGDMFAVVRPRGKVTSRWTRKDNLGFYVQEVGALEVIDVKRDHSVTRVKKSCDNFLLGDLVQRVPDRVSPLLVEATMPLDRFADASGKATGRILLSRDNQEMLTRDQIVYVDLGADENLRVGDRLTIFRPLDKGNLGIRQPEAESVTARSSGFPSNAYKGGKFSNQASRKSGDRAQGQEVTTSRAKKNRPFLRKVVGEGVVLNVKERTATVVITRTAQEIHTGDWVEIR